MRCVRLPLDPLPIGCTSSAYGTSAGASTIPYWLLWGGRRPMVRKQICIQRTLNKGLDMPDLESHWLAERLAYLGRSLTGDAVWRHKASRTFPLLKLVPKAEGRRKPMGEALFVCECRAALRNLPGCSELSRPRKELYRELVVGSTSDPLSKRHGWTAEDVRSHWNWAPGSSFLNSSEFSLTWRLARNPLPLLSLDFRAGLADTLNCARCGSGLEETAEHAFYYCDRVRPFWDHVGEWTARIEPKQLVLLDVGYVVDNVLPPFQGEKHVMFLAIPPLAPDTAPSEAVKGHWTQERYEGPLGTRGQTVLKIEWWFGRRESRDCMTRQTFHIVIWFCTLGISLGSKSDVIENAWIA